MTRFTAWFGIAAEAPPGEGRHGQNLDGEQVSEALRACPAPGLRR